MYLISSILLVSQYCHLPNKYLSVIFPCVIHVHYVPDSLKLNVYQRHQWHSMNYHHQGQGGDTHDMMMSHRSDIIMSQMKPGLQKSFRGNL